MKMSQIQWCHSTINPAMGCDGCELAPPAGHVRNALVAMLLQLLPHVPKADLEAHARGILGNRQLSGFYRDRKEIEANLVAPYKANLSHSAPHILDDVIRRSTKCYALLLGIMRAGHPGYADTFEEAKLFPGRMAEAARWPSPSDAEQSAKPWLSRCRRMIFVSDMGDALSRNVDLDFLKAEVIDNVVSPNGRRHFWLWLTKRPERMVQFARWLGERDVAWPANLVAMTTVTSSQTVYRVNQLRQVPAQIRGLSVEPLFGPVDLPLEGIDWIIVGGGSDVLAEPFHIEWSLSIMEQCQQAGVAFFLKQLGKNPFWGGRPVKSNHRHGGDWNEWPTELRVRQVPEVFRTAARPHCRSLIPFSITCG